MHTVAAIKFICTTVYSSCHLLATASHTTIIKNHIAIASYHCKQECTVRTSVLASRIYCKMDDAGMEHAPPRGGMSDESMMADITYPHAPAAFLLLELLEDEEEARRRTRRRVIVPISHT